LHVVLTNVQSETSKRRNTRTFPSVDETVHLIILRSTDFWIAFEFLER